MNSTTSGGGVGRAGSADDGRAEGAGDRSDMGVCASELKLRRRRLGSRTRMSANETSRVGGEYYAGRDRLRRGSVHQVIHNNFHSAPPFAAGVLRSTKGRPSGS